MIAYSCFIFLKADLFERGKRQQVMETVSILFPLIVSIACGHALFFRGIPLNFTLKDL